MHACDGQCHVGPTFPTQAQNYNKYGGGAKISTPQIPKEPGARPMTLLAILSTFFFGKRCGRIE